MFMDIYTEIENLVKTHFTGRETHQELRTKVIRLPLATRTAIKDLAAVRGCASRKGQVTEAIYWILHDLTTEPLATCPICDKQYRGKYYSIIEGYQFHNYCSISCRNKDPQYAARVATTNLARYGHANNMHGPEIRARTKQKWMDKYGTDVPIKAEKVKAKVRATNQQRRGVDWPAQDKLVWAKYEATMMSRYGVNNGFKHENVKITNLERYGFEHPTQNPAIFRKTLRGLKRTKTGIFPSGTLYIYQGYENVAIDKLLQTMSEDMVLIGDPTKLPVIEYINPVKEKMCRYFPDIWIPHTNTLIEVKSSWTMKRQYEENLAKHQAAKRLGFKHEIWICSEQNVLEVLL